MMRNVTRMKSCSAMWLAAAMLAIAGAQPLAAQLDRPPTTTPTIYVAGPAWFTAAGYRPTWIILKWKAVPNARSYRVFRWSDIEKRHLDGEWQAADMMTNKMYDIDGDYFFGYDAPVDMTSTYSYDVQAVFVDANGNSTYSSPSPAASAKSPPFVAPSNFKYTAALYQTPGKLRLTFTWDPVLNAQQYDVRFQAMNGRTMPMAARTAIQATRLVVDDVSPHSVYNVCIITVYLPSIRDDNVRSCIDVKLR